MSAHTIVDPTGVPYRMDTRMPINVQTTEKTAEQIVTDRKLLNTRIAANAGKMISADTKREPTSFMETTMITAIMTAMNKFIALVCAPAAFAKFSSKVTEKMRL